LWSTQSQDLGALANPVLACGICGADPFPFDLLDFKYQDARPRDNAHSIRTFLNLIGRKPSSIGLDYGGGNGRTSLLMREKSWSFDSFDPFGSMMMDPVHLGKFNFSSAIEVFEHTTDPVRTMQDIVSKMSSNRIIVLIITLLSDDAVSEKSGLGWRYAAPRNGHVSLYSRRSLEILAYRFDRQFLCLRRSPQFVFRGYKPEELKRLIIRGMLLRRLHLLQRKFQRN
jgi:hypothetical protein